jgi:hypothetical protein
MTGWDVPGVVLRRHADAGSRSGSRSPRFARSRCAEADQVGHRVHPHQAGISVAAHMLCTSRVALLTEPADCCGSSRVVILSSRARLGLASDHCGGRCDVRLALGNRKTAGQRVADLRSGWCAARDSNPEPADYESVSSPARRTPPRFRRLWFARTGLQRHADLMDRLMDSGVHYGQKVRRPRTHRPSASEAHGRHRGMGVRQPGSTQGPARCSRPSRSVRMRSHRVTESRGLTCCHRVAARQGVRPRRRQPAGAAARASTRMRVNRGLIMRTPR